MQSLRQLFCFFIAIITWAQPLSSIANTTNCSFKGKWFARNKELIATFNSGYSPISGETSIFENVCGRRLLEGFANDNSATIKLVTTPGSTGICALAFTWVGNFSKDCSTFVGNMSTQDTGSTPFQWFIGRGIKINTPSTEKDLIITSEPRMPDFSASVLFTEDMPPDLISKAISSAYDWKLKMHHVLGETGRILDDELKITNAEPFFTPSFEQLDGFRGGNFKLSVTYYDTMFDEKNYVVKGTNPGKELINQVLNPTMRHIACVESGYRQFKAAREGGVGFPLIGLDKKGNEIGGIGLMQLYDPPPFKKAIWNWRENINEALVTFEKKQKGAQQMRQTELIRLNKERQSKGLSMCPEGALTPLNLAQLERETLRRYNCGREYRWEPRDAKNCEGDWVIDLSCVRQGKEVDLDYVNKVLSCSIN